MTKKEILDKIKGVEKILTVCFRLARIIMKKYNRTTKIFSANFEVFDDKVNRNSANIDKISGIVTANIGKVKGV